MREVMRDAPYSVAVGSGSFMLIELIDPKSFTLQSASILAFMYIGILAIYLAVRGDD